MALSFDRHFCVSLKQKFYRTSGMRCFIKFLFSNNFTLTIIVICGTGSTHNWFTRRLSSILFGGDQRSKIISRFVSVFKYLAHLKTSSSKLRSIMDNYHVLHTNIMHRINKFNLPVYLCIFMCPALGSFRVLLSFLFYSLSASHHSMSILLI